jgi:hypothetical protein
MPLGDYGPHGSDLLDVSYTTEVLGVLGFCASTSGYSTVAEREQTFA